MQYTGDSPDPKKVEKNKSKSHTVGMYDRPKSAALPFPPMILLLMVVLVIISMLISYFIFFR